MESKFARLRQRDNSTAMLRVKMSRRRSLSQKENRQQAVNTRRRLDALTELEESITAAPVVDVAALAALGVGKQSKYAAGEERLKQLQRWKEKKALEKEKEQREKNRGRGVFKVGLYQHHDTFPLPGVPRPPAARVLETSRVTRSMRQHQQKPQVSLPQTSAARKAAEHAQNRPVGSGGVRPQTGRTRVPTEAQALSTRPSNKRLQPVASATLAKPKPVREERVTRATAGSKVAAPPTGASKRAAAAAKAPVHKEPEVTGPRPDPTPESKEEEPAVTQAVTQAQAVAPGSPLPKQTSSFAPQGFVFQPPVGLSSFKLEPLTPRSAQAFLSPSFPLPPSVDLEPLHDVPYFRAQIRGETDKLTSQCLQWAPKVDDNTIPEEMRDSMRTAVGQARLLMKERFGQFAGLVDDCDLGRGEKVTTCSDLQGFWDMVYCQVEDVLKKFEALTQAEARGWVEEQKPPPRQRRPVKKPLAAPRPAANSEAAKSRLAAVKAAMRARKQEGPAPVPGPGPAPSPQPAAAVVFDGTFFKVESPAKTPGVVRRSCRLSPGVSTQASSPCLLHTRRSARLARASPGPRTLLTPSTSSKTPSFPALDTPTPSTSSRTTARPPLLLSPTLEARLQPEEEQGFGGQSEMGSEDSSIQEIPGLDFERYLQPTERLSLSPREPDLFDRLSLSLRETVAMETSSPTAAKTEAVMESPVARPCNLQLTPTAPPRVSPHGPLHTAQPQMPESDLLCFMPDPKDRIRQSVCPSDLMAFTP